MAVEGNVDATCPNAYFQGQDCERRLLDYVYQRVELFGPGLLHPHLLSVGIWVLNGEGCGNAATYHTHAKYEPLSTFRISLLTLHEAVSSTGSGLIVHWVGRYRECILFGWVIWAAGLGLFSTLDQNSGLGKQIGYGILTGVGVGNTLQP
jgi:hypothetical protein